MLWLSRVLFGVIGRGGRGRSEILDNVSVSELSSCLLLASLAWSSLAKSRNDEVWVDKLAFKYWEFFKDGGVLE